MGDDHTAKSSTLPHQSEFALIDAGIPILNPSSIQEILDYGLYGWAMSRYSGCWVGLKTLAETMDASASVNADSQRVQIIKPHDFELPDEGVHIRNQDTPLAQEARLYQSKLYAAIAFARANGLNRMVIDSPHAKLGIITTGKSYLDVRQALSDLGIDGRLAHDIGIRLYKVGMPWPLDKQGVQAFANGLDEILVVEEKRALIENQLKEQLYNLAAGSRPGVIGKCDEHGNWLLPPTSELTPARIARVIAQRIGRYVTSEPIRARLEFLEQKERSLHKHTLSQQRKPHFCSGCPHNTSTKLPDGSRAMAGIGCHYMVTWMDRNTDTFTQMGGEGVPWTGIAPFCKTGHIFANLGDGTYFHSGSLAIRAAVASGVNITYKLLYNNAVAMTGGQALDGELSIEQLSQQLAAEGVKRIVLVSHQPDQFKTKSLAEGVEVYPRSEFDRIQLSLRETKGVSALIYDQMCATEKRRQIKRGNLPPTRRFAYINTSVCDNCGDCSRQSNCLAVEPVETSMGTKRQINQAACNHDYSCVKGFCPSFVSIEGKRKKSVQQGLQSRLPELPEPSMPDLETPYSIVLTGVGGTGIVTLSAILGVAAHLEGKGVSVLDMTGLAQKFGAVSSHIQFARQADELYSSRIAAGQADLLLGCDAITSGSEDVLAKLDKNRSCAIINSHASITADYLNHPDRPFPDTEIHRLIKSSVLPDRAWFVDSTEIASKACGDPIASNMLMTGYAWQMGLIPLGRHAIEHAIELNKVAVEMNLLAFNWGRRLAINEKEVKQALELVPGTPPMLDEVIEHNADMLREYQDDTLAERYLRRIDQLRSREHQYTGKSELSWIVTLQYARLLAIKDEYEVARLLTSQSFKDELSEQFEPGFKLSYHLAPPILAGNHDIQGNAPKKTFGAWLTPLLRLLANGRKIRNSMMDPFRYTAERRENLALLKAFERFIDTSANTLCSENHSELVSIAASVIKVSGYGHQRQQATKAFIDGLPRYTRSDG